MNHRSARKPRSAHVRSAATLFAATLAATAASCGQDGSDPTQALQAAVESKATGATDGEDTDAACVGVRGDVPLARRPVDIILTVDNSGSMTDEIVAIQNNLNTHFADVLSRSGLDYRVILVSRHGSASATQSVCISRPLSTVDCTPVVPAMPGINPGRFYQYSIEIGSLDSFVGEPVMDSLYENRFY